MSKAGLFHNDLQLYPAAFPSQLPVRILDHCASLIENFYLFTFCILWVLVLDLLSDFGWLVDSGFSMTLTFFFMSYKA